MTASAGISLSPIGNQQSQIGNGVRLWDYVLVGAVCLVLFGWACISGRPLTLHEARLPETSREMIRSGDWVVPRSGGRPWLERPPLPQWIEAGVSAVLGRRCDAVWVVRLPAALCGLVTVLLTVWIAGRLFGRGVGVTSGLVMATMYEFYEYCCLAEDDIFLAIIVTGAIAGFVAMELPGREAESQDGARRETWWGWRSLPVLGMYVLLGLSNIAKALLLGVAVSGPVFAVFLATRPVHAIRRYAWLWGWLVFAAIAMWWPLIIFRRYPDVWHNWRLDYAGTTLYDEPWWYYLGALAVGTLPWTVFAGIGLWKLWPAAWRQRASAQRFVLCWAIVPMIVFSMPARKHHHYMVPFMAPWGVVAAVGLVEVSKGILARRPRVPLAELVSWGVAAIGGAVAIWVFRGRIPGPAAGMGVLICGWIAAVMLFCGGLAFRERWISFAGAMLGIGVAYCWGQSCIPDETAPDTAFLNQVEQTVPADGLLTINAGLGGELDFFRNAFYVRPNALLLHNLTFLRDRRLPSDHVYVVTRHHDLAALDTLGKVHVVLVSSHTRREHSPQDRFTLFELWLSPTLTRYSAPAPDTITTMQAMGRQRGPYCGPPL